MTGKILDFEEVKALNEQLRKVDIEQVEGETIDQFNDRAHDLLVSFLSNYGVQSMFFAYADCIDLEDYPSIISGKVEKTGIVLLSVLVDLNIDENSKVIDCQGVFGLLGWDVKIGDDSFHFKGYVDLKDSGDLVEVEVIPLDGEDPEGAEKWRELSCACKWPIVSRKDSYIETSLEMIPH